ncbi:hypothetical protein D3C83_110580 [compost metagenome]
MSAKSCTGLPPTVAVPLPPEIETSARNGASGPVADVFTLKRIFELPRMSTWASALAS